MPVKDHVLLELMDKIVAHFRNNIYSQILRKALMVMELPQRQWDTLDNMDEKVAFRKSQGYELEELYEIIIAAANFIYNARHEIKPRLKTLLEGNQFSGFDHSSRSSNDRILRDMAISNFSSNFSIFADQINELYLMVTALDRTESKGRKPVATKYPELKDVGQLLIES